VFVANHLSEAPARPKREGEVRERMLDASEFDSLDLSHVSTRVVLPSLGWTHWQLPAPSGAVSVRWAWERLQLGVLCIANPLAIEVDATLMSPQGMQLSRSAAAVIASRAIAKAPWQAAVQRCIEEGAVLTDREGQCLRAIAEGLSAKEAGLLMGVSAQTVSNCLSSAYRKLGIQNRGAAMREAVRLAIVPLA
jgi:DNA-binding CsgD family transcriptional regulator